MTIKELINKQLGELPSIKKTIEGLEKLYELGYLDYYDVRDIDLMVSRKYASNIVEFLKDLDFKASFQNDYYQKYGCTTDQLFIKGNIKIHILFYDKETLPEKFEISDIIKLKYLKIEHCSTCTFFATQPIYNRALCTRDWHIEQTNGNIKYAMNSLFENCPLPDLPEGVHNDN